jgi:predicted nucleic acid-binding protein
MTLAELEYWGQVRNWGERRRTELNNYLARFVVAHTNADLCRWWGVVYTEARRKGMPIQPADAWIAATALLYDIPLVSHNPADFAGVAGLTVISEAPR